MSCYHNLICVQFNRRNQKGDLRHDLSTTAPCRKKHWFLHLINHGLIWLLIFELR